MSAETPSFQATLAEPLNFGQILEICGKVGLSANRISFNFSGKESSKPSTTTPLHTIIQFQILLDFYKKQILFTQFQSSDNTLVVSTDLTLSEFLDDFKFYIMFGESKFHVAFNNEPLINFKYQQNLADLQIQTLTILGQLEYIKQLDHHKYFPYTWPPIQIIENYLDFSNDQPMAFQPGHIMTITARLHGNTKGRFIIQFRHARDNKRQELHVSVRFDTQKIIRNSKSRQADEKLVFGQEEIDNTSPFPFEDFNKPFKLSIAFCETEFRLAKDGKYLCNFTYRSTNVLPFIMGPKIFGTNGLNVRVWGIEHLPLVDVECKDFEMYSMW
ncbi:uncharacterized protein ACRADG_012802 isoform 2-T2 [Cochliomyia hominivorax]